MPKKLPVIYIVSDQPAMSRFPDVQTGTYYLDRDMAEAFAAWAKLKVYEVHIAGIQARLDDDIPEENTDA